MLKKKIKYTDYNGVEREEEFLFNLTKAELLEMQMSTAGGFENKIQAIIATQNMPEIVKIFKEIILKAYGEKSEDGKRFIKKDQNGRDLALDFSQTEAYSNLFTELATDAKAAAAFINGIIPKDVEISEADQAKIEEQLKNNNLDVSSLIPEKTDSKNN